MRQASKRVPDSAEKTVRDIRRATRRHHSAEEKIRIVLEERHKRAEGGEVPFPRGQTKKKTPQKRGRYSCSALCMDNPWGDRGGRGALALFDHDAVTAQEVKQIKLIEKHIHGLMAASTPRNPRRVDTACPFRMSCFSPTWRMSKCCGSKPGNRGHSFTNALAVPLRQS